MSNALRKQTQPKLSQNFYPDTTLQNHEYIQGQLDGTVTFHKASRISYWLTTAKNTALLLSSSSQRPPHISSHLFLNTDLKCIQKQKHYRFSALMFSYQCKDKYHSQYPATNFDDTTNNQVKNPNPFPLPQQTTKPIGVGFSINLHTFQHAALICKDTTIVLHCTAVFFQI